MGGFVEVEKEESCLLLEMVEGELVAIEIFVKFSLFFHVMVSKKFDDVVAVLRGKDKRLSSFIKKRIGLV